MNHSGNEFERLEEACTAGGVGAVLDTLIEQLRAGRQYHELFEALKMRLRHQLGLPLRQREPDPPPTGPLREKLEEGLLGTCREVGFLLLQGGQVRDGWMYLRAVGDNVAVAQQLQSLDVHEDNVGEVVEVLLHEGVDHARGFALVLEHYGTCDAITTYDATWRRFSQSDQRVAAGYLVDRVHEDLVTAVASHIAGHEGREPESRNLRELIQAGDFLFDQDAYHIDTTHLAATVRIARVIEDKDRLRRALGLAEYGEKLHPQFQYPGEEPFGDAYTSHALFFRALLGERIEEAVQFFGQRMETLDPGQHGTLPTEIFVQLLQRLGRFEEALDVLVEFAEKQEQRAPVLRPLLDLSDKAGRYERLISFCRQRGDLLGFAIGLAESRRISPSELPQREND